ncbi:MAG: CHAP domain-containing protein [Candidatus Pedobacter colombiensis]|uniref:CHAP domain-containing protein n=1 Tax=Candidatus Pedobacter colombiensis TaxID=3121371 RepID=A0AAJ6B4Y7_9SPHI|nr:CHAP domain-containing protein [Pedobacter sp.]WEK18182.1 MAG: CHAP domain-containing protein [Pedobacter sp.]
MTKTEKIIQVASRYVGYLEIRSNAGFYDAAFEAKMKSAGWYRGAPWCAFFAKSVFAEVYAEDKRTAPIIRNTFTGGVIDTLKRVKAEGTFATGPEPKVGALVMWRMGKTSSGHAGIVISVDKANNTMQTIEGNTNASGSREGDCVAKKLRTIHRDFRSDGLNVEGYIYPLD